MTEHVANRPIPPPSTPPPLPPSRTLSPSGGVPPAHDESKAVALAARLPGLPHTLLDQVPPHDEAGR